METAAAALASGEGAAPAVSPLGAATTTAYDEDDVLPLAAGGGGTSAAMALTMQALFGPIFQVEEADGAAAAAAKDPALVDTRSILADLFGGVIREDDVHLFQEERYGVELLTREMKSNKDVLVYEEGARYFGTAGADVLRADQQVPFTLLDSSLPEHWETSRERASTASWLLDMPVIFPRRQTLHADPRPCDPSTCAYLESNKYMLFTPSNVLRWSVNEKGVSSNSRIVRWSDGSITLHVGNDVLTLLPSQEATLNLLGEAVQVGKAGMELDAVVASTVPEKHLTARLGEAASIEAALAQERRQREVENRHRNLPYADTAMPPIDWARPRKGRTIQEEFVREEYDMREREMKRRIKEGRPMTLAEQLQLEARLQDHVTGTSAEELQAEREEHLREAALKAAQRAENRGQKRNRFDRDLGLHDTDFGTRDVRADPFLDGAAGDGGEGEEEEQDVSDADSFEQQLSDMYARNNAAAPAEKKVKQESTGSRYTGLSAALRALLLLIPMNAEAFASVDGTLSFLAMDNTPEDLIRAEVPKMLAEVAAELPSVNTQRVRDELAALFPQGL
ncbi:RNA polymerase-associated protein LEO1 [Novymonas esmeraldas]|uniref:RNA polymerase-associated protein LEO1 n=1 Tax=Novymonas esmeraldas TaxID=1808958 RepID=A0AAW0F7S8_9TRYP